MDQPRIDEKPIDQQRYTGEKHLDQQQQRNENENESKPKQDILVNSKTNIITHGDASEPLTNGITKGDDLLLDALKNGGNGESFKENGHTTNHATESNDIKPDTGIKSGSTNIKPRKRPRLKSPMFSFPGPTRTIRPTEPSSTVSKHKRSPSHPKNQNSKSGGTGSANGNSHGGTHHKKASHSGAKQASASATSNLPSASKTHTHHNHEPRSNNNTGHIYTSNYSHRNKDSYSTHYAHQYKYLNQGSQSIPPSPTSEVPTPTPSPGPTFSAFNHTHPEHPHFFSPASPSDIAEFVKLTAEAPPVPESLKPSQASALYSMIAASRFLGVPMENSTRSNSMANSVENNTNSGNVNSIRVGNIVQSNANNTTVSLGENNNTQDVTSSSKTFLNVNTNLNVTNNHPSNLLGTENSNLSHNGLSTASITSICSRASNNTITTSNTNNNLTASLFSNEPLAMTFPHIVRPVPVFVADQLTQSRKTTIASYISSNDSTRAPGTHTSFTQPASLPQVLSLNNSATIEPTSQQNSNDISPSGASTNNNRHSLTPSEKQVDDSTSNGFDVNNRNSSYASLRDSGLNGAAVAEGSISKQSFRMNPPLNSLHINTNINQATGLPFVLPTSPTSIHSVGGPLYHRNFHSQSSINVNNNNINDVLVNSGGGANNLNGNPTYLLVQSVIAEKQRQLEASSGASRWMPFVAATMPLQLPQASGLSGFEHTTRIRPEDLDDQFSLNGVWIGHDEDSRSRKSANSFSRMVNYILCCFMAVDNDGRQKHLHSSNGAKPGYCSYDDEELGLEKDRVGLGTGAAVGANRNSQRRMELARYNEKYEYPNNNQGKNKMHGINDANSYSNESNQHSQSSSSNSNSGNNSGSGSSPRDVMNLRHGQYGRNVRHYVERKKRKWQPKIVYVLLNNPLVPLTLRLFNFIISLASLALACSVFVKSQHTSIPQQPSIIMAIIVQSCALLYLVFISYDEYSGKPVGLRDLKGKMRLIMLDLLFIIFASANLSLAFNTLFDPMWLCKNENYIILSDNTGGRLDPTMYDPVVCRRQRGLVSFLMVVLISWIFNFTVSMFRLIERISGL